MLLKSIPIFIKVKTYNFISVKLIIQNIYRVINTTPIYNIIIHYQAKDIINIRFILLLFFYP